VGSVVPWQEDRGRRSDRLISFIHSRRFPRNTHPCIPCARTSARPTPALALPLPQPNTSPAPIQLTRRAILLCSLAAAGAGFLGQGASRPLGVAGGGGPRFRQRCLRLDSTTVNTRRCGIQVPRARRWGTRTLRGMATAMAMVMCL